MPHSASTNSTDHRSALTKSGLHWPKNKSTAIGATLCVAALAIASPIWLTVQEARRQGLETESNRALAYAKDVLHRSDATADQVAEGFAVIKKAAASAPCSEDSLALMRQVDLGSSYIQAIGHVEGNRLVCSSLGIHGPGLELGPVDLASKAGTSIRTHVRLPFAPKEPFIVIELDGYAAVVHRNLPIDATTDGQDVGLAIFSLDSNLPLSERGQVLPAWKDRLGNQQEVTFIDGQKVVAVAKSKRYRTAAVAAISISDLDARTREVAMHLVPIGLVAGVALAAAMLYLARMQLAMPAAIRGALKRHEFFLQYQPIVDLKTGAWVGAEALIRWRRPTGEIVSPDLFIPIAEENGLIERITERVIELVIRDAEDLFRRYPDFHIAINLSPADLHSRRTPELLTRMVEETGAKPGNLIVEATERGFLDVDVARAVADDIRSLGIGVAIDDFGTGYSSLAYLETLAIDFLKIDMAFVKTIGKDAPTSQVVHHIIRMAQGLKLQMIAEGVETEEQAVYLRDHGVEFGQGWLFGKPMGMADIEKQLN